MTLERIAFSILQFKMMPKTYIAIIGAQDSMALDMLARDCEKNGAIPSGCIRNR